MPIKKYTVVPGRGLLTKSAIAYRKEYLEELGYSLTAIENTTIDHTEIQNNIESLVGSVEIPMGLVGPLLYRSENGEEEVFCVGATLEGALIASMNRGAKAVSMSGGFKAEVIHQKMVRSPLFILSDIEHAKHFENWVKANFDTIKVRSENYSNHAVLHELILHRDANNVHVNFVYTTGDAAGQNMTTSCTWHGILWIVEQYRDEGFESIHDYVLEGNGSSDKKVSQFLIDHGRGSKVIAKSFLDEEVIAKVLRTSSDQLLKFYGPSRAYAKKNGMVGYTINASNAIAAIFAATGQDLASIHESSVAELTLEKHPKGLEVTLTLFALVIGTLGGGTHLPKQQEALKIMDCVGSNKVQRFASLIAGFVLGLELSTYAAMVSGEFAKAHEKLGRNKPIDWLQWNEVDDKFIRSIVSKYIPEGISEIKLLKGEVDNGILMNLSKKVNRKLIGFIPVDAQTKNGETIALLLKSKATDLETIKGLHIMAASIDPALSDLITQHKNNLEHRDCHTKELSIPQFLHANHLTYAPHYYGSFSNDAREIYILAQERLLPENVALMDSENSPELWSEKHIKNAIYAINEVHQKYLDPNTIEKPQNLLEFDIKHSIPLYEKLVSIAKQEDPGKTIILDAIMHFITSESLALDVPKTLVHNDYNPRNIAVRRNGEICIYDWELAVLNYPHRDIVELLSFTLPTNFERETLFDYLNYHYSIAGGESLASWENWKKAYSITLMEYILSRVLFYCAAEVLMKLKFVDRIFNNAVRMLNFLEE